MAKYLDGTDLLLGIMDGSKFRPLGHSTGCKISYASETADRTTKEAATAKFKESYVKSLSCSISADGFVYDADDDPDATTPSATTGKRGFNTLRDLWMSAAPVNLQWKERDGSGEVWQGSFIIESLEEDGTAGDDRKWSISFKNNGAISKKTS